VKNNLSTIPDTDYLLWCISTHNDQQAFRSLFDHYYASLCLYAKRYIDDRSTREDIVQDVFFTIWEKRNQIEVNTSAKNYLITSVKHTSLNYLRKLNNFHDYQDKIAENPPVYSENIDELYNLYELEELLHNILKRIPEEYAIAFTMSRFEDKSTVEIAEALQVSVRTVERYRNRAVDILKNELKDFLPFSLILPFIIH